MPGTDRISYDTGVSSTVQTDIGSVVGRLETLINTRQGQVNRAMADFQADGVSEDYRAVEQRWNTASGEVRTIINLVKSTLGLNDDTALNAQRRAQNAVHNIG
ncbi:pore-forming ESAT-6 family protein [Luteipulveratus sp. YIM 133132]|uniref:Pore-forming ESAT-6 family protein n=1 Tax=Luteipulveratus flavus TaxID=3031728 RepID=A0ABT6C301_9MICO|nr:MULTISPECIES: pore-forming ESAT-6 family protein [unclassified Luteipulveratus]MDE9367031.1 pore-forming ESAT-6 family protein [Luteipulveratus sp. YIM 133132]MDF8263016.1 pore-forming ESAT-6 family protein [Luteipulveratus sp. YIM 133296]